MRTRWSRCECRRPGRHRRDLRRCPGGRSRRHGRARGRSQRRRRGRRRCGPGDRSRSGQRCRSRSGPDHHHRRAFLWHILIGQQKATKYRHQNHPHDHTNAPGAAEPICEIAAAIVLPEFDITRHASHPLSSQRAPSSSAMGRIKLKVLPTPISLSTQIRPPWASTRALTIERPTPVSPKPAIRGRPAS